MTNSFVKIDTSNNVNVFELTNQITSLKLKLEKVLGELVHAPFSPNYKYLFTYMYKDKGVSYNSDSENLYAESQELFERLVAAGVPELKNIVDAYVEFKDAIIDNLIEDKMVDGRLVINGSDIRYRSNKESKFYEPWLFLNDDVQVHVYRLELTNEEVKKYEKERLEKTIEKIKKLGFSMDDNGNLIVK